MHSLKLALLASLLTLSSVASAAPVTWEFEAELSDGGSAFGTYTIDLEDPLAGVSNVYVTTTAGSRFSGAIYQGGVLSFQFPTIGISFTPFPLPPERQYLNLDDTFLRYFVDPAHPANPQYPTTISVVLVNEGVCTNVFCYEIDILRGSTYTGTAVSNVPLPAAAWLFGSAFFGLGALKRKQST